MNSLRVPGRAPDSRGTMKNFVPDGQSRSVNSIYGRDSQSKWLMPDSINNLSTRGSIVGFDGKKDATWKSLQERLGGFAINMRENAVDRLMRLPLAQQLPNIRKGFGLVGQPAGFGVP